MIEPLDLNQLQSAVVEWARSYYDTDDIVAHIFDDEDDDPDRYIAVLAVRGLNAWQAVEVWLEGGQIVALNDLGEGVLSEDAVWPWPD